MNGSEQPGRDGPRQGGTLGTSPRELGLAGSRGSSAQRCPGWLWQGTSSWIRAKLPASGGTRDHADGTFLGAGQRPGEHYADRSNILYILTGENLDSSFPLFCPKISVQDLNNFKLLHQILPLKTLLHNVNLNVSSPAPFLRCILGISEEAAKQIHRRPCHLQNASPNDSR